jgi:hypothetical protein
VTFIDISSIISLAHIAFSVSLVYVACVAFLSLYCLIFIDLLASVIFRHLYCLHCFYYLRFSYSLPAYPPSAYLLYLFIFSICLSTIAPLLYEIKCSILQRSLTVLDYPALLCLA